ncbi:MAG: deoxyuridine 5-triphosphate nucleotidohydrolase [Frondihabitans sp.]|nr:deoxyuridine 5-triphosphate nucleotidohydrolase [Frondihabitans sp.]
MTQTLDVLLAPAAGHDTSVTPTYAHPGDAGADLLAAETLTLAAGHRALISTGVSIALPDGYAAFVVPRSGLAAKHGITVLNAPGTVDAGYRGEIKVTLLNTDPSLDYEIQTGDKIAQLIVMPVVRATFIPVEKLPESLRGEGGFGSTGYSHASGPSTTPGGSK